jgi:hypothetical protein
MVIGKKVFFSLLFVFYCNGEKEHKFIPNSNKTEMSKILVSTLPVHLTPKRDQWFMSSVQSFQRFSVFLHGILQSRIHSSNFHLWRVKNSNENIFRKLVGSDRICTKGCRDMWQETWPLLWGHQQCLTTCFTPHCSTHLTPWTIV